MTFPFSSRTVGLLVRVIDDAYSKTEIRTLLLEADAEPWDPENWPNKQSGLQQLFRALRADPKPEVERVALEIVQLVLRRGARGEEWSPPPGWWKEVIDAIAADGWEFDRLGQRLIPTVPGVRVAEETSYVAQEFARRGWATEAGHFQQALDAYGAGNWASANAQLRSLLESLLPAAAELVSGVRPKEVQAALDALLKKKILVEGEYSLVKGLWDLSQPRGSHPGLSDEEEARFRLMTITSYGRFLLARLPRVDGLPT